MKEISEYKEEIRKRVAIKETVRRTENRRFFTLAVVMSVMMTLLVGTVVAAAIRGRAPDDGKEGAGTTGIPTKALTRPQETTVSPDMKTIFIRDDELNSYTNMRNIVNDCDLIAVGTVLNVETVVNEKEGDLSEPGNVNSFVTMKILNCISGKCDSDEIVITENGGVLESKKLSVTMDTNRNAVAFNSYVVFLKKDGESGNYVEVSPAQGKTNIRLDGDLFSEGAWKNVEGAEGVRNVSDLNALILEIKEEENGS